MPRVVNVATCRRFRHSADTAPAPRTPYFSPSMDGGADGHPMSQSVSLVGFSGVA